jgi:hypothetical protein
MVGSRNFQVTYFIRLQLYIGSNRREVPLTNIRQFFLGMRLVGGLEVLSQ